MTVLFVIALIVILRSGTLRPDLIESASELASHKADAIKTHHNDTDLVRELRKQVMGLKFDFLCTLLDYFVVLYHCYKLILQGCNFNVY